MIVFGLLLAVVDILVKLIALKCHLSFYSNHMYESYYKILVYGFQLEFDTIFQLNPDLLLVNDAMCQV